MIFNEMNPYGKFVKSRGQIYHHKHKFVADDYKGFNVSQSKARSESYSMFLDEYWACRIGYRSNWNTFLNNFGIEE